MNIHNILEFKNVFFRYNGQPVLENVNLTVKNGDFASIVGPNGGGKTTLLKLILGLLKPNSGKITVLGKTPQKSQKFTGYMSQQANLDFQFPITVKDIVLMGRLANSGLKFRYSKEDIETAESCLEEVNLSDFADKKLSELSSGQRQRVFIARALCCHPKILLLDEPTSNIDIKTEENIFEILVNLNKKMTILLVAHDLGFVSRVVKTVVCVNRKVVIHPTSDIDGAVIQEIYGGDISIIRHDHRCSEKGHFYD